MDLWTPSGNVEIDNIDMQLEQLFFSLRRCEDILKNYELNLADTELKLRQVRDQLLTLKRDGLIVSMEEYGKLRLSYQKLIKVRGTYLSKVNGLYREIETLHKEIDKLYKKRSKIEPKILEFKKRES